MTADGEIEMLEPGIPGKAQYHAKGVLATDGSEFNVPLQSVNVKVLSTDYSGKQSKGICLLLGSWLRTAYLFKLNGIWRRPAYCELLNKW